jgi:hypothetical protein
VPVLLGFAGLAIDAGVLRYERRLQQTAADAAAVAGASEVSYGSVAGITSAAQDASASNGYTITSGDSLVSDCAGAPVGTVCVQVNSPPLSGPHTASTSTCSPLASCYVEVLVAKVQPTYFMKIFGVTKSVVTARAVATLVNQPGQNNDSGCVYSLDSSAGNSLWVSGGTQVQAPTCGISVDGGFTADNNGVLNAGAVGVVGSITGSATCQAAGPCPAQQATVPDPLSWLNQSPPACNYSWGNVHINNTQVASFPAGVNCVTNFIVDGGATVCNSSIAPAYPATPKNGTQCPAPLGTNVNSGVTFYVTSGGTVTINGGATVELMAPNSGPYAGILFYEAPSTSNNQNNLLSGNSSSYYQGALYFPTATLAFQGNGAGTFNAAAAYTTIVAYDVKFGGGSAIDINSNYSSLPKGWSMISNAVLVE